MIKWKFIIYFSFLIFSNCASIVEIRIENKSLKDYNLVFVGDTFYGDILSDEISDFHPIKLKFKYTHLKLLIDGKRFTGQTLNFGSDKYTYIIDLNNLEKRQLKIDIKNE